jgi:hypothetical protein
VAEGFVMSPGPAAPAASLSAFFGWLLNMDHDDGAVHEFVRQPPVPTMTATAITSRPNRCDDHRRDKTSA